MKKYKLLLASLIISALCLLPDINAQDLPIPGDQEIVVIDETTPGKLETIINNDTVAGGNRANPNRIYMLKSGQIYVQVGPINFGGDTDSTATLNIIGESGGAKPMVLMNPGAGNGKFQNVINGSITLKNVYWGATNMNGESANLFDIRRTNQRIIADGIVVENAFGGAVFNLRKATGTVDAYLKNSYFRDNSQLANSWNRVILSRGDNGEIYDTVWVENVTVSNAGMPFFGKMNPVNFFFFNHNLIVNTTKYPIWYERHKEAYITNNMFINANYEGECRSTWETQIAEDFIQSGLVNLDTVEANWFTPSVTPEEVIFYAADNLSFTSPYMDNYWAGAFNSVADHPISNRVWGSVTAGDLPLEVKGIVPLYNGRTLGLADAYDKIKIERTHENVDPQMVTKGIANQNAGNQFAYFARQNYGVADAGETHDKSLMYFGDADPATIPGGGTENGFSIVDMTDIPEDFSYDADIISGIDSLPLGSLAWYPEIICRYDSEEQLQRIKDALNGTYHNMPDCSGNTAISDKNADINCLDIYPNPVKGEFTVKSDASKLTIYNSIGQMVMEIEDFTAGTIISTSTLEKGNYVITDGKRTQQLVIE